MALAYVALGKPKQALLARASTGYTGNPVNIWHAYFRVFVIAHGKLLRQSNLGIVITAGNGF